MGVGEGDNPLFAGAGTQKEKKEAREPNIRGEEPKWGSTPTRAHGNFEEEREDEDEENHTHTWRKRRRRLPRVPAPYDDDGLTPGGKRERKERRMK